MPNGVQINTDNILLLQVILENFFAEQLRCHRTGRRQKKDFKKKKKLNITVVNSATISE